MPLYEYQCQSCGDLSEVMQRMSDPPLTTCEVCGGELKKLISAPAFQFKGSGWYVTDYADKGGKKDDGKGDKKDKGSDSSSSSDSDSKDSSKSKDSGSSSSDSSSKSKTESKSSSKAE
ncbi:MAG: FmdB family zinc ribbon protein [Acidobacteriota bacterium]